VKATTWSSQVGLKLAGNTSTSWVIGAPESMDKGDFQVMFFVARMQSSALVASFLLKQPPEQLRVA
jgi:hypothetical protein